MGKVVLMASVSLDGFMEAPGGDLSWHLVDDELHTHFNQLLAAMGAFLEGRVTYELMETFWPTADTDPANAGPMAEFAAIWRDTPKVVYSRTLARAGPNATIVRDVVPAEVMALKAQAAGDLALGGAGLAAAFMAHDLVDEYRLYFHPVVLGRGKQLFPPADAPVPLRLVETRTFGTGVVLLRHRRDRAG